MKLPATKEKALEAFEMTYAVEECAFGIICQTEERPCGDVKHEDFNFRLSGH